MLMAIYILLGLSVPPALYFLCVVVRSLFSRAYAYEWGLYTRGDLLGILVLAILPVINLGAVVFLLIDGFSPWLETPLHESKY